MKTRKHTDEADADSGKNKPLINKRQAFHLLPSLFSFYSKSWVISSSHDKPLK